MAMRRLRERVRGMPAESPPEWLPNGWSMDVRNTRHGKYRYYTSPVSGCTFQSKVEVLHHLSVVKHDDGASGRASCSSESKKQLEEEMKESLEWLPSGWILEIKTRRSGKRAGKTYKCYFEPLSGNRFYSKGEVLRFLSSRKVHDQTSEERRHLNRNSTDNVKTHIEYTPDGLPDGWIKETKFGEGNGGLSKNPYYTDPINGYVFNSLKDAIHYVETGYVSKHAYKQKRSAREACSFNDDSPSPDSVKKLKSQPTAKKHHLTEEILNSNGELSETATVPDRLLPLPSSQENDEVKPEKETAPESAKTLSAPCPANLRERTPKNGRVPKMKCTRKSNAKLIKKSNEKANMESEENIQLEELTEKHIHDKANQGAESKPVSTTNSNDNSKEEGEATPEVARLTEKSPPVSKDLQVDDMELIMANPEKADFLDPPNKSLLELEKELPVVVGNPSTPDLVKPKQGSRKTKTMSAISMPRRLSRRLASVKIDHVTDVDMGGERPRQQNVMESGAANTLDSNESNQRPYTMEDWPEFPSTSPFGDSWPDPCIEFAFKTLTGDLPVLDDAITVQEYFQQQLFSAKSSSPDVIAPASNNKTGVAPASDQVEVKLLTEQDMQNRCHNQV